LVVAVVCPDEKSVNQIATLVGFRDALAVIDPHPRGDGSHYHVHGAPLPVYPVWEIPLSLAELGDAWISNTRDLFPPFKKRENFCAGL
jgi:hypothetical protein